MRPARRCSARPTWTSSRWAPRTRTPATGPVRNPWDPERVPGGSSGGSAAAVAGAARAVRDRHRHRRVDPPAGLAVRDRRAEAHLRRDLPLRDDRLRLLARPVRTAHPRRHGRRAAAARRWRGAIPATPPRSGSRAGSSFPRARTSRASASAFRASSRPRPRGSRRASRRSSSGPLALIQRARGRGRRVRASALRRTASRPTTCSPRRRLRRTSPATTAFATGCGSDGDGDLVDMYERTREPPASAPRSSAASCSAPTRSRPATTTPTTAAPSGCGPGSPRTSPSAFERFDYLVTPDLADGRLRARAPGRTDPLAMYLSDYCTVPMSLAGIPAISIPAGLAEPDGGGPELPVGLQIVAPAFAESRLLDAAHAIEGGDRLRARGRRGDGGMSLPEGYEAVIGLEIHVQLSTRDEDVLRLRPLLRRRAQRAHLPGLPRPSRDPCPTSTSRRSATRCRSPRRSTARSPRGRSSTARTTSTPTTRRATRSASTTSRSPSTGRWARCASIASISRRTPRR